MSTWDYMSDSDYQACQDAGRGMPPDPRDQADQLRKERQESSRFGDAAREEAGVILCQWCGSPDTREVLVSYIYPGPARVEVICGDCGKVTT